MTDALYDDPSLARFYDSENGWAADCATCHDLARDCHSVLDIGCGTGLLAARLALDGKSVTGVDAAAAMLAIARARPGGQGVRWIEADARSFRLGQHFDLIVMTGHAFQVFLTEADRAAVLQTLAAHLAPRGRFIFDSRNPARREWREWTPAQSHRQFDHPDLGPVEAWNDVARDATTGIVTYDTFYRTAPDATPLAARSRIAFPSRAAIARACHAAGLSVDDWYGDWQRGPWHAGAPEIIPLGRLG